MTQYDLFTIPEHLRRFVRLRTAGGVELHTYDSGDGGPGTAPLLLVHGLGDEADSWRRVFVALASRRRVIAVDLPGFGRSERPHRAYTLGFFARTLAALLESLGIERAVLMGSSMGAAAVQRLALARPHLAERLILVDGALPTFPVRPPPALLPFLTPGLGELAYTSLRRSQQAAYDTLRPYYYDLDALPEEERAFLWQRVWARVWSNGQRRAYFSALRWMMAERILRASAFARRLPNLRAPTLIIWGAQDQVAPESAAHAAAAVLPSARVEILDRCGHLPHQDRPDEVVALLDAWLADIQR
jgi:pimeloyl-ACP methyl ester carboxylesterase